MVRHLIKGPSVLFHRRDNAKSKNVYYLSPPYVSAIPDPIRAVFKTSQGVGLESSLVELKPFRIIVMILNFRTYMFGQTVQTQIRLLLEEQSDQGLHCLLFHLHVLRQNTFRFATLFEF